MRIEYYVPLISSLNSRKRGREEQAFDAAVEPSVGKMLTWSHYVCTFHN